MDDLRGLPIPGFASRASPERAQKPKPISGRRDIHWPFAKEKADAKIARRRALLEKDLAQFERGVYGPSDHTVIYCDHVYIATNSQSGSVLAKTLFTRS